MTKLTKFNDYSPVNRSAKRKNQKELSCPYLIPIDEVPELYHPYSEVNLFLSQQLKQELQNAPTKIWSIQLEKYLLEKMSPVFHKRFPQFRISISAIKRTWENLILYTKQIQDRAEAITEEGKVNIPFLIKENLKNYLSAKRPIPSVPYQPAYQMANRISECIAAIDGEEPRIEELTKMIWTAQCHLDSRLAYHTSPYYNFNQTDELIVKTVLEIKAKHPHITYSELEYSVLTSIRALYTFPIDISEEMISDYISLLLADKLYNLITFDQLMTNQQKASLESFICRHSLCKKPEDGCLSNQLRRITALYALAARIPKNLTQMDLKEATLAVYPANKENPPNFPQAVYAFITTELSLMQNDEFCYSLEHVVEVIWHAYQEALFLPDLAEKKELLEVIIWKNLVFPKQILDKIPPCITQKIEEEIANALIDNPNQSFYYLLQVANRFFKRVRELIQNEKWPEIEKKSHYWSIQGDMLCQWIEINVDPFLLQFIYQKWTHEVFENHEHFVHQVHQEYLQKHPKLHIYTEQLYSRIWTLYKYTWYNLFSYPTESCIERFIKWHIIQIKPLSLEDLQNHIKQLIKDMLPLIPFDAKLCEKLFYESGKEAKFQIQ
jgi:hypothetical protein